MLNLSEKSLRKFLLNSGVVDRETAVDYYPVAVHFGISPHSKREVLKLKSCCRKCADKGLISISNKDGIVHMFARGD